MKITTNGLSIEVTNNDKKNKVMDILLNRPETTRKRKMTGHTRKAWSKKEDETLSDLKDAGFGVTDIGKDLSRTPSSVSARMTRLKNNK